MLRYLLLLLILISGLLSVAQTHLWEMQKGQVRFTCKAPQENISATSAMLSGVLDVEKKQFAFKIDIASFNGFNNALQKNHFNENYMETAQYAQALFKGKIIEAVDFTTLGVVEVRAKGKLIIHGVEQERIIKVQLKIGANKKVEVKSKFPVLLPDHNIKIPKVVTEKLSAEILVEVSGVLQPKS